MQQPQTSPRAFPRSYLVWASERVSAVLISPGFISRPNLLHAQSGCSRPSPHSRNSEPPPEPGGRSVGIKFVRKCSLMYFVPTGCNGSCYRSSRFLLWPCGGTGSGANSAFVVVCKGWQQQRTLDFQKQQQPLEPLWISAGILRKPSATHIFKEKGEESASVEI